MVPFSNQNKIYKIVLWDTSHNETCCCRSAVVFFTLTDFFDLLNGYQSMKDIATRTSPPWNVSVLHCCGCICLLISVICLFFTATDMVEICPCSDILSVLTVWVGDTPQAYHHMRFSKSHLDPRTFDAVAVLIGVLYSCHLPQNLYKSAVLYMLIMFVCF